MGLHALDRRAPLAYGTVIAFMALIMTKRGRRPLDGCSHVRDDVADRRECVPQLGNLPLRGDRMALDRTVNVNSAATSLPTLHGALA